VRRAKLAPRVGVVYSTPGGEGYQDPLEFANAGTTIDRLIALCGGVRDDAHPDLVLAVRLPHTDAARNDAFLAVMRSSPRVALADLSFEESYAAQDAFASELLRDGIASRLDAYAGWNTAANTVGTALGEAFAAAAGRALRSYDANAHRTFTFMRFVDDVAYHDRVRPALNDWLAANGVSDHTYLLPDVAARTAERNRALLWYQAQAMLAQLYPGMHVAAMTIALPWDRTFETSLEVRIAPDLP
jgi:hypothetical protein